MYVRNETEKSSLVFVHQSSWQRDMLHLYGGDYKCSTDATYKTTVYIHTYIKSIYIVHIILIVRVSMHKYMICHRFSYAFLQILVTSTWQPLFYVMNGKNRLLLDYSILCIGIRSGSLSCFNRFSWSSNVCIRTFVSRYAYHVVLLFVLHIELIAASKSNRVIPNFVNH